MTDTQEKQESDVLISFSDFKRIWRRNKQKIKCTTGLFAFLAFMFGLISPIQYESSASFREKNKSESGVGAAFILMSEGQMDSDALTMMSSRKLLEEVVKEQGLQGTITKEEFTFPLIPFATIKNNLLTEYALFRKLPTPIVDTPDVDLKTERIIYQDEIPIHFNILVTSDEHYTLKDLSGNIVGYGIFGVPFSTDKLAFIIKRMNPRDLTGNVYTLTLQPASAVALALFRQFLFVQDKGDKSLLKITHRNLDRKQAAKNVNVLMDVYQRNVFREHENLCQIQINYLRERREDAANHLELMMQDNAEKFSEDLSSTGFATSEMAMEYFTATQQKLSRRSFELQLEIQRLEKVQSEEEINGVLFCSSYDLSEVNEIINERRKLEQYAKSLRIALMNTKENGGKTQIGLPTDNRDVDEIKQGLDLLVAKELYAEYVQELSKLESTVRQHEHVLQGMDEAGFKITSLSTVLSDPISQDMIGKVYALLLNLDDYENRSIKERERLNGDIGIQKEALKNHVQQSLTLIHLQHDFFKEKITQLQKVLLSLILDQLTIVNDQLREGLASVLENLRQEKELIGESIIELRSIMATFPKQWAAEQLIAQQMGINKSIVEEVTRIVESKNISNNLEKFQSAPVDIAVPPIHPRSPHLLLLTLAGAFAGAFISFVWCLVGSVVGGLQVSPENLRAAGYHVSGMLSKRSQQEDDNAPLLDDDLETLRRLIAYMTSTSADQERKLGQSIALLEGNGPNYTNSLAELMSKMGFKVVVIDVRFDDYNGSSTQGVLQYFEEKIPFPSIVYGRKFDFIGSGGVCRYSNELICSQRFKALLNDLSERYQWIIVSTRALPQSAEAGSLLDLFSCVSLSVSEQSTRELGLCLNYAKKPGRKVSFVFVP